MKFILRPSCKIEYQNSICDVFLYRISALRSYLDVFTTVLATEEYKRANSFLLAAKKEEFILCRGLLRILLNMYTGTAPEKIIFAYEKYRKPIFWDSNRKQFFFNLSHSHDLVAYVFNAKYPVGIDVEFINPIQDFKGLAMKVCTTKEYESLIEKSNDQEQVSMFYDIWVQKEACLKALGIGLQRDLREFAAGHFPQDHTGGKIISINDLLGPFTKAYKGAIAIHSLLKSSF